VVVRPVITKTQLVYSTNTAEKHTIALHMQSVPGSNSQENDTLNQDFSSKQAASYSNVSDVYSEGAWF